MEKLLSELEAILKVSGIASASLLPQWARDRLCQSVAIDIVAYYEPLIQQLEKEKYDLAFKVRNQVKAEAAREIFEEIEKELVLWEDFSVKTQHQAAIVKTNWWESLKSKYGGQK